MPIPLRCKVAVDSSTSQLGMMVFRALQKIHVLSYSQVANLEWKLRAVFIKEIRM